MHHQGLFLKLLQKYLIPTRICRGFHQEFSQDSFKNLAGIHSNFFKKELFQKSLQGFNQKFHQEIILQNIHKELLGCTLLSKFSQEFLQKLVQKFSRKSFGISLEFSLDIYLEITPVMHLSSANFSKIRPEIHPVFLLKIFRKSFNNSSRKFITEIPKKFYPRISS